MSVRNLDFLLRPASVAVIGATDRPQSVGATVMRNLLAGGFRGRIVPVNPRRETVAGLPAVSGVEAMEFAPDLAVICTPAPTVPGIIRELGRKGTRAAVVLTAGLNRERDASGRSIAQAMLDEARPHLLRILGPNCVGLLVPGIGLNASFAHTSALPGSLAFVSQSGALTTALLDWSKSRGIGFSHFVSLGDAADVDFGDMLDYLGSDAGTSAILLYIESISSARKFMSAARAAARNKPVIVVKSGRVPEGARAAASHTGAMAGADDVCDAAIRRAGMLRVDTVQELFSAAETLAAARPIAGDRLAIMTNGGGAGVMAADALVRAGGKLAKLDRGTLENLNAILPPTWSGANPVDIVGDAPPGRYAATLDALLQDAGTSAVLLIHAPTAIVPGEQVAQACVPVASASSKPVLSCWLGGDSLAPAREQFALARLPAYDTPEDAVGAFVNMVQFQRNQALLSEIPAVTGKAEPLPVTAIRNLLLSARSEGRDTLNEQESKRVLSLCGIPVVETRVVASAEAAATAAAQIGFPVAVKVLSPQVSHKADVGGVSLNLRSADAVRDAALEMAARLQRLRPDATLSGFTVQPMVIREAARELILGLARDPVFGPVVLFGQGGTAVEVVGDRAVALPPLNLNLATDLISRTRVSRLLQSYRDRPAADHDAICRALIQLSRLAVEIPEIAELDINPLLADDRGVIALDARVRIVGPGSAAVVAPVIAPYPDHLEQIIDVAGEQLQMRPVRPEDAAVMQEFIRRCRREDLYMRFFGAIRDLAPSQLARLTQIDYDREMSFLVLNHGGQVLAEARAVADPDNHRAEFAILVSPEWQGRGLGRALLSRLVDYCRSRGTGMLVGEVMATNSRMLDLARELGFERANVRSPGVTRVVLPLVRTAPVPMAAETVSP